MKLFTRRKKGISINDSILASVETTTRDTIESEPTGDLSVLTRKHKHFGNIHSPFTKSKNEKDILSFTAVIDSIDGIICTKNLRQTVHGQRDLPVFAILSYHKKVVNTGKALKTNMLSLPLLKSSSSIGNRERLYANFSEDEEPQSFSLSSAMRRDVNFKSGYEPRELDFEISLMRGSEVIKMGIVPLILTGEENGCLQMISIQSSKTVRKSMTANKPTKISVSSVVATGNKMISFRNDSSCKYSLQRSVLRLSVSIQKEKVSPDYMQNDIGNLTSMMLSIGTDDNVSVLSNGGASTMMRKQDFEADAKAYQMLRKGTESTSASGSSESFESKQRGSADNFFLPQWNALDALISDGEEDSSDSESDSDRETEDGESTHIEAKASEESEEGESAYIDAIDSEESEDVEGMDSDEDSTLLDNISLGTIQFTSLEANDKLL